MQPVPDPYLLLGVPRGASVVQIKAAHRSLAKRYHPDAPEGDTIRFLAVQDAYLLLTDPIRRRDWDARHAPGPVRAGEGPIRGRRGASGRWTREEPEMGTRRGPRGVRRPADGGRDTGARSYTWSAEGVPWWDEPPGRGPASGGGPSGPKPGSSTPPGNGPNTRPASPNTHAPKPGSPPASRGANEFDVYTRSSGAAWSSAARRYFREADSDLPHRGVFRRQGTQYVTGARARQAAESEARSTEDPITRPRPGAPPARQAFEHEPQSGPRRTAWERAPADGTARTSASADGTAHTSAPPAGTARASAPPDATARRSASPPRTARERRPAQARVNAPELPRRIAEITVAWVPLAAGIAYGVPSFAGCDPAVSACSGLVVPAQAALAAILLGALIVFPPLTRVAAFAATGALAVAIPMVIAAALLGLSPPAPLIAAGGVGAIGVGYAAGACLGAFSVLRQDRARPADPGPRTQDG